MTGFWHWGSAPQGEGLAPRPSHATPPLPEVGGGLGQDAQLVPFKERVEERFQHWLAQQANQGRQFTYEQLEWLRLIRDHIASSMQIDMEDFDYVPFDQRGGRGKVYQLFGNELGPLLEELNKVLAA